MAKRVSATARTGRSKAKFQEPLPAFDAVQSPGVGSRLATLVDWITQLTQAGAQAPSVRRQACPCLVAFTDKF